MAAPWPSSRPRRSIASRTAALPARNSERVWRRAAERPPRALDPSRRVPRTFAGADRMRDRGARLARVAVRAVPAGAGPRVAAAARRLALQRLAHLHGAGRDRDARVARAPDRQPMAAPWLADPHQRRQYARLRAAQRRMQSGPDRIGAGKG